jgi:hypothetical protein
MRFFETYLEGRTLNPDRVVGRDRDDSDSYYVERDEGVFPRERFELSFTDASEIEAALNAQWAGSPFAGLGTRLMELSKHFEQEDEKKDVSSFVYEMF